MCIQFHFKEARGEEGVNDWKIRRQNESVCCFYCCAQFFIPQDGHLEIAFCENAVWVQIKQQVNVSSSPSKPRVMLPTLQGRLLNSHLNSAWVIKQFCPMKWLGKASTAKVCLYLYYLFCHYPHISWIKKAFGQVHLHKCYVSTSSLVSRASRAI